MEKTAMSGSVHRRSESSSDQSSSNMASVSASGSTTTTSSVPSTPIPSVHIIVHKLNGGNYLEWAQSMKLAIDGRGKLGHLIGDTKRPSSSDPTLPQWRSDNSLIISWLINSMEPAIGKPCLFIPMANEVWDAVRECYSDLENSSQIFELKTRLWQSKQGISDVQCSTILWLLFKKTLQRNVETYTDADWTGSITDRRSTSCYCTYVWGNLVTWRSKKQRVVARSSAEAEYHVMSNGVCEMLWLKRILEELKIQMNMPMKIYCDNKAVISIA